jgi:hypothetical protein
MASNIIKVLKRYGIEGQLLSLTSDSTNNNGTLAMALRSELVQFSIDWE